MRLNNALSACAAAALACAAAVAESEGPVADPVRAKFHYQLFCQGCHVGDGSGGAGVPPLKGQVGHFLKSQNGREYLPRVPGVANSVLADDMLAEVLNWAILAYGGDSMPADWRPYRAEEVGELRRKPLDEVVRHRAAVLREALAMPRQEKVTP